jgi:hypothetical protein
MGLFRFLRSSRILFEMFTSVFAMVYLDILVVPSYLISLFLRAHLVSIYIEFRSMAQTCLQGSETISQ